ncbi:MAG: molybdopterin molybdotransferase MoeA [Candidatus Hodarchaeales archaeon]|jgi:molybdopterin molybdotransferase
MTFDDIRLKGFSKRIKIDKAIQKCIEAFNLLPTHSVSLQLISLKNKILREDIFAKRSIPPFDRSAVDGYAVRAEDTFSASETNPQILNVIGQFAIGQVPPKLKVVKYTAIQIPTGGVIPEGTNAVIMVEDTAKITENEIEIYASLHPGKNISKAGEDIEKNQLIFKSGRRLRGIDRGFLLSAGINSTLVSKIPSIAIIATGDELLDPWDTITPGKIPEINTVNLFDMCLEEGWNPEIKGIIHDQKNDLREIINECVKKNYDVVLLSGGTSVGQKDFLPILFNELGTVIFHGIAMRPGGPVVASKINDKLVFGIPGFPTAALIAFRFVVRPIILSLMGQKDDSLPKNIPAKISRNVGSKLGRLDFLRVKLQKNTSGDLEAVPIQIGGSGVLTNMVNAHGIIPIPESSEGLKRGDIVDVILLV